MRLRRTMLIVPAVTPEFLVKSRAIDADVLILDVQDAVANVDKAKVEARAAAEDAIRKGGFQAREISVRVNSPGTPWLDDDITAMVAAGADSLVLSRGYCADDILAVEEKIQRAAGTRRVEIILEVDTAGMLVHLEELGRRSKLVTSLSIASGDFALDMQAQVFGPEAIGSDEWLQHCRGKVVAAARWKRWNAADYVRISNPNDVEGVRNAIRRSRSFGFDGMTLLYPRFVSAVNEGYGVSEAQLAWARRVVDTWKSLAEGPDWNKGAHKIDGQVITAPIYESACRVVFFHSVLQGDEHAVKTFRDRGFSPVQH